MSDFEFYLFDMTISRNGLRIVRLRGYGNVMHKDPFPSHLMLNTMHLPNFELYLFVVKIVVK